MAVLTIQHTNVVGGLTPAFSYANAPTLPTAPTLAAGAAGSPNGTYKAQVTFVNGGGETVGGAEATVSVTSQHISWTAIATGPTGTTSRKLYRTAAGGATGSEKFLAAIADNTTTTYDDNVADGALGATISATNTAAGDIYANSGAQTVLVKNLSSASVTITVTAQNLCNQGFLHTLTFSIPANTTVPILLGPFAFAFYNDVLGNVNITYSSVVQPPPGAPSLAAGAAGSPNGVYKAQVTFVNAAGETSGGTEATITVTSTHITWSSIPLGPAGTTSRKLYRTVAGGATGTEKLVTTLADNTTTTFDDNVADGSLGATVPAANTASAVQVAVTAQ